MLTRIAGGEIIDPVNGRAGIGDLWIMDEAIVAAPPGGQADRTIDACRLHRHGRGHRHPFPYRRRQCEHRAAAAAGAASRAQSAAGGDAALQRRLVDLRDRLPLCQDGLHHGGRARHVAGSALHTHLELADIPIIDKATLAMLGNDDFLLVA